MATLRERKREETRVDANASAAGEAAAPTARLGALDTHLLAEGRHWRSWQQLGAHAESRGGGGARFAVWAPNARRVSAIGDWNGWDGRANPLRRRDDCGVWEGFVAGPVHGSLYKFEIEGADGAIVQKTDPYALWCEAPPRTAARIWDAPPFVWSDHAWMEARARAQSHAAPMSIYELHVGSWRRTASGAPIGYAELAEELVPYVLELGFTHIELLPIAEHPFGGSWGYQTTAPFAPSARWGTPDDLRRFVDRCHRSGVGVLFDWVAAHFPSDAHALARFDGTCLYEHEDPRRGRHPDWGTLIYNYGRREVANYLIANAVYWLREFHADGLRVDAVASMLYHDYSRAPGEWLPNPWGGRENVEAIDFLRLCNDVVHREAPPGAITIAEESTSWPLVTRPTEVGGLGFDFKWNLGWMNDTLRYFAKDPVHRRYHHELLTFGQLYAYSEHFVLPLSHDEVVHGKGSLLGRMPGDDWQRFANLRLLLAWQIGQPGKKLLFMGGELGSWREWDHDGFLDWQLLDHAPHRGIRQLTRDLLHLYRAEPCLHSRDADPGGFEWIDCQDVDQSVVAWRRRGSPGEREAIVVCNFTPVVRHDYRVGAPLPGVWREALNTDGREYGGSGVGNLGAVRAEALPWHGHAQSLRLVLPPLAALILRAPEPGR